MLPKTIVIGSPRIKTGFLGNCLIWLYLLNGFIGKSRLPSHWYGGWRGYIIISSAIIMMLLLYCLLTRKSQSYNAQYPNKLPLFWLLSFILWGIVVSMLQEYPFDNLIYFIVLASMFIISIMLPNRVVALQDPLKFLNKIVFLNSIYICLSLALFFIGLDSTFKGRLCGLSENPIVLGGLCNINCLLLVWLLIESSKNMKMRYVLLLVSLITLVLTKCRGQIITTIFGIFVLVVYGQRRAKMRIFVFAVILLGSITVIALSQMGIFSEDNVTDVREFLRIPEGEISSTLEMRYDSYWSKGINDVTAISLIGQGPLARFGGGGKGFETSHYDRSLNRHSQPLLVAQAYGFPGLVFWIAFLLFAFLVAIGRPDNLGKLGAGFFASLIIMSMVSESLMSFGTPVDRLRWLILGILLASPLQAASDRNLMTAN